MPLRRPRSRSEAFHKRIGGTLPMIGSQSRSPKCSSWIVLAARFRFQLKAA